MDTFYKMMNLKKNIAYSSLFLIMVFVLNACYSFTGGSLPEHLSTVYIANVVDNSGYGNPVYKDNLQEYLSNEFTRDRSLSISDRRADSRLEVTITSIKEQAVSISQTDFEKERKIVVSAKVVFFDNVEKKIVTEKTLSGYAVYEVATAQSGRDESVDIVLKQLAEDILFAVVSGW